MALLNVPEVNVELNSEGQELLGGDAGFVPTLAGGFTNTPFHTVKLNYVLQRLGVLCWLGSVSPGAARSLRVKRKLQHISQRL